MLHNIEQQDNAEASSSSGAVAGPLIKVPGNLGAANCERTNVPAQINAAVVQCVHFAQ